LCDKTLTDRDGVMRCEGAALLAVVIVVYATADQRTVAVQFTNL